MYFSFVIFFYNQKGGKEVVNGEAIQSICFSSRASWRLVCEFPNADN